MNEKKVKKLRKILKYHPRNPREYETKEKGQIVLTCERAVYQAAKKKVRWN